jgi:hypothetical protein
MMPFQHGTCKKLTLVIAVFALFFLGFTADQAAPGNLKALIFPSVTVRAMRLVINDAEGRKTCMVFGS